MNLGNYEIALIGVGGIIVGVILGSFCTYYFSLKLSNTNSKKEAIRKFRNAFYTELFDLYPTPVNWPDDIEEFLKSKYHVLHAAVLEFRNYLPAKKWDVFDNAWFAYYCSTGREVDKNSQIYHHYVDFTITDENGTRYEDGKKTFKQNVDALLNFIEKI